jgi:peptidoglycan hydrolase CwlO-like protein
MKNLNNTQTESIFNFLNNLNTEVCITDYVNIEDIDFENAFDSIQEKLNDENGFDMEVIYYGSAIDYLKENDPSLKESLELASDMGFELKNLSSEVLASLLKTENEREKFNELESEINDFFSELL